MTKNTKPSLSDGFMEAFSQSASRLGDHKRVEEQTEISQLEEQLRTLDRKINAARIGGVGNVGKLTEQKVRVQVKLDEAKSGGVPGLKPYMIKKSSLGHTFVDVDADSKIGKAALASGKYKLKKINVNKSLDKKGYIHHVVPVSEEMDHIEEALDPVNKKALKKDFDDRKDQDLDNDGDTDASDKYLHKRRKAISKAVKRDVKEEAENLDEGTWSTPNTMEKANKLATILRKKIPAKDAPKILRGLIGDDDLFDFFMELEKSGEGMNDVRTNVKDWVSKNLNHFTRLPDDVKAKLKKIIK